MNCSIKPFVFGEVLFDCFPTGERILGGAPFNVAWHLQALGDRPQMISRVGDDELGRRILAAMADWGMELSGIQIDPEHPTGRVDVHVVESEPSYNIIPDCAYDFIDAESLAVPADAGILYHGTLGLRNAASRRAFATLARNPEMAIFLDVNLRPPWWQKEEVVHWLERAQWVKLNREELRALGFASGDIKREMAKMQERFCLEQVILTRGEDGSLVSTSNGEFHEAVPEKIPLFVDTVGAGDAFSAVYIHGLRSEWPISRTLEVAQRFASRIIGLRGATTTDPAFYREFIDA